MKKVEIEYSRILEAAKTCKDAEKVLKTMFPQVFESESENEFVDFTKFMSIGSVSKFKPVPCFISNNKVLVPNSGYEFVIVEDYPFADEIIDVIKLKKIKQPGIDERKVTDVDKLLEYLNTNKNLIIYYRDQNNKSGVPKILTRRESSICDYVYGFMGLNVYQSEFYFSSFTLRKCLERAMSINDLYAIDIYTETHKLFKIQQ